MSNELTIDANRGKYEHKMKECKEQRRFHLNTVETRPKNRGGCKRTRFSSDGLIGTVSASENALLLCTSCFFR